MRTPTSTQADLAAALAKIDTNIASPRRVSCLPLTDAQVAKARADLSAMMASAERVPLATPDMNGNLIACGTAYVFGGSVVEAKKAA